MYLRLIRSFQIQEELVITWKFKKPSVFFETHPQIAYSRRLYAVNMESSKKQLFKVENSILKKILKFF